MSIIPRRINCPRCIALVIDPDPKAIWDYLNLVERNMLTWNEDMLHRALYLDEWRSNFHVLRRLGLVTDQGQLTPLATQVHECGQRQQDPPQWTPGAAWVIASRERERHMPAPNVEAMRTRYVLFYFLQKCNAMILDKPDHWFQTLGGIDGVLADLNMGEFSILEYVDDLLAQARVKFP
jgi:hypothetical protein